MSCSSKTRSSAGDPHTSGHACSAPDFLQFPWADINALLFVSLQALGA